MNDIDSYICTYAGDDLYIRFAWNGKHGNEFEDTNQMFRRQVMKRVLQQQDIASLSLVLAEEICAELTRRLAIEIDTKRREQLQDDIKFFAWRGEQSTRNSPNQQNT